MAVETMAVAFKDRCFGPGDALIAKTFLPRCSACSLQRAFLGGASGRISNGHGQNPCGPMAEGKGGRVVVGQLHLISLYIKRFVLANSRSPLHGAAIVII